MRHPSYQTLQDYLEAHCDSPKVQEHLASCERCSKVVSEMAKVDIYVTRSNQITVGEHIKQDIFTRAEALLQKRRAIVSDLDQKRETRAQHREIIFNKAKLLKDDAIRELLRPAMQSASIAIILIAFVLTIKSKTIIKHYKVIEDEPVEVSSIN